MMGRGTELSGSPEASGVGDKGRARPDRESRARWRSPNAWPGGDEASLGSPGRLQAGEGHDQSCVLWG